MSVSVRATYCEDIDDVRNVPGAFEYYVDEAGGEPAGMIFNCPCGCMTIDSVAFRPRQNRPVWSWDGNREAPTLQPSLHRHDGNETHWHGYLKAGVWEPC